MSKKLKIDLVCKWTGCSSESTKFEKPEDLSQHVDEIHLGPCAHNDLFFCQWEGCKVYNKPSFSYSWLKRHTKEKHTKERPNKCLMNGCNMSFNSVDALQRHMMRHFERTPPAPAVKAVVQSDALDALPPVPSPRSEEGAISDSGSSASSTHKGVHRPRKRHSLKVRISRRHLFSFVNSQHEPIAFNGAHFHGEVLDHRTMDVIKQTVNALAYTDTRSGQPTTCFTLYGQVIGRRKRAAAEAEVLVRWKPRLISDCWVPVCSYNQQRVVSTNELSTGQLSCIAESCFSGSGSKNRKNKRKPGN
ncbi:zinc finger protein aebp2-like [Halichondria panicea]|uniref:zinc finger protein aebp2-like n=1 Tax=Halichondria panicea TaxID=6063 RepID=UPI00312B2FF8